MLLYKDAPSTIDAPGAQTTHGSKVAAILARRIPNKHAAESRPQGADNSTTPGVPQRRPHAGQRGAAFLDLATTTTASPSTQADSTTAPSKPRAFFSTLSRMAFSIALSNAIIQVMIASKEGPCLS